MNASMNGLLIITDTLAKGNLAEEGQSMVLGIQTVETGVFGGIITGVMTALLHNKYHKISLPSYLGFLEDLVLFQLLQQSLQSYSGLSCSLFGQ